MASAGPKVAVPKNVVLETNMGTITVELYFKHAPATCKNFSELARRGYYNGTVFHRIIKVRAYSVNLLVERSGGGGAGVEATCNTMHWHWLFRTL